MNAIDCEGTAGEIQFISNFWRNFLPVIAFLQRPFVLNGSISQRSVPNRSQPCTCLLRHSVCSSRFCSTWNSRSRQVILRKKQTNVVFRDISPREMFFLCPRPHRDTCDVEKQPAKASTDNWLLFNWHRSIQKRTDRNSDFSESLLFTSPVASLAAFTHSFSFRPVSMLSERPLTWMLSFARWFKQKKKLC